LAGSDDGDDEEDDEEADEGDDEEADEEDDEEEEFWFKARRISKMLFRSGDGKEDDTDMIARAKGKTASKPGDHPKNDGSDDEGDDEESDEGDEGDDEDSEEGDDEDSEEGDDDVEEEFWFKKMLYRKGDSEEDDTENITTA